MALNGLEQGRARYAYDCARQGKDLPASKEYKSYVKKIPALIKMNGLGATLAFIAAKKKDDPRKKEYAYKVIYDQLKPWLVEKGLVERHQDLVAAVVALDSLSYRMVTGEVLALFKWISRFAEGLIEGEADE
ncbi:type III-B CRISPR module-associated protein Cmr5 [Moorella sp. Hama-1]|uniref:type III-B CRISPR module-associated protein Cmr5 n=1 Tax=Moorella sp. Hama-1 TaxID=2138101 RepID=UPI000D64320B|nr:type III-B CRISPR module-associated protein Cmr5 [Moorella sp. Hama-1]BCV20508.1 type III-B CRISPR module-associated protein Cmr5 [Moorella sp. Hama-1]